MEGMELFIDSIKLSLRTSNWHAALLSSLCLPDICGFLNSGERESKKRYVAWFNKYLGEEHAPSPEFTFLSGSDCYALRCALLHQGQENIDDQRSRDILDEIVFVRPGSSIEGNLKPGHCFRLENCLVGDRRFRSALILHVDVFCRHLSAGAEKWLSEVKGCRPVENRMASMLHIY